MKGIESVLLDSSFCIRLLKKDDDLNQNAIDYFKYFLDNQIELYLSTIVVSEYAVGDDPDNLLSLNTFRILEFDYTDAKFSGQFLATLRDKGKFSDFGDRKVVINDVKLFAQIHNRNIDAYISKDITSIKKMIEPLSNTHNLKFHFIDLSISLKEKLGKLF
jgi:predicted nucleic acid-binding protein